MNIYSNNDDFRKEYYHIAFLKTRWGLTAWDYLVGLISWVPFSDKLVAVSFLILSAVGLCFIFYQLTRSNRIINYTLLSSLFVTYPLYLNIAHFSGANYASTGGLLLSIIAICALNSELPKKWQYLVATFLLILPVAGYEVPLFSYLTIISIIFYYQYVILRREVFHFKKVALKCVDYVIPLLGAFVIRIIVANTFNWLYNLSAYKTGAATDIRWLSGDIVGAFVEIAKNGFYYGVAGLVYLPITTFVVAFILFVCFSVFKSIRQRSSLPVLLACFVILCVFSLSILQGSSLNYRTAQTLSVFVSFVVFLLSDTIVSQRKASVRIFFTLFVLYLSWWQAQEIHRDLSLCLIRSNNEIAMGRSLGKKLTSEYPKKPVVFVSFYSPSKWLKSNMTVDTNSWNGALYKKIAMRLSPNDFEEVHAEYSRSYINITSVYVILQQFFSFCGYDIDVLGIPDNPAQLNPDLFIACQPILKEATRIAKEKHLRPYDVYDNGDYLIVQMSGMQYYIDQ